MPQYDLYHNVVKTALVKEGWIITDDPFTIEYKGIRLYADLGAEKALAAEKQNHKIVVEIKVFRSPSLMTELEKTVGQYSIYRSLLRRVHPERELHLAVAQDIYQDFFQRPAIQEIVDDHQITFIIFDPNLEEIVQWIN